MAIRPPAFGDHFYPASPDRLNEELDSLLAPDSPTKLAGAIGCISPHAGYMYSGAIAGAVFSRFSLPDRFVILGPNHSGIGAPLAILSAGEWETPLGRVPVDGALAVSLKKLCRSLQEDARAHAREHSLEVQLPFLQKLKPDFRFVPIAIGTEDYGELQSLGHAIAEAVRAAGQPALVIASSDMNHFEDDQRTRHKDRLAIDRVLALDPEGLYETVRRERISMCGYCPAVAMLVAARTLGAAHAELVRYGTSADVSRNFSRVVGYAGMVVW